MKWNSQRSFMCELYRQYSGNEEKVVRAYAEAEDAGRMLRRKNKSNLSAIEYARALWKDGIRRRWLYG